nr:GNAT family N-acetyltransferase [Kribbella sandramycini]
MSTSYWATGIPRELVAQALAGSLNVGVYAADGALVAFARAVTDRTTFAWIADVFVLPEYQGHGLGKFVVATLLEHPELQGLRSMMLATNDAHELYRRHGFTEVDPGNVMALRHKPTDLYR